MAALILPDYFSNSTQAFNHFDTNKDSKLDFIEFTVLTQILFSQENGEPYPLLPESKLKTIFDIFNKSKSGYINKEEFEFCWTNWINKILNPISALIVVDVQNDFISGTLAVKNSESGEDGFEVVQPINHLTSNASGIPFNHVFFTFDWHPENHISFIENVGMREFDKSSKVQHKGQAKILDTVVFQGNPPMEQILWPKHAVQKTWGSELHKDLKVPEGSTFIYKATDPELDAYSGFWDNTKTKLSNLHSELQSKGIQDIYITGLCYDICAGSTGLEGLEFGYRVIMVEDAMRSLSQQRKAGVKAKIIEGHGVNVQVQEVKAMVQGKDRRPELGYKLALNLLETTN